MKFNGKQKDRHVLSILKICRFLLNKTQKNIIHTNSFCSSQTFTPFFLKIMIRSNSKNTCRMAFLKLQMIILANVSIHYFLSFATLTSFFISMYLKTICKFQLIISYSNLNIINISTPLAKYGNKRFQNRHKKIFRCCIEHMIGISSILFETWE